MKKIILSSVAVFAMNALLIAGGDIIPAEEPVLETPVTVHNYIGAYLGVGYSYINAPIKNFNTFADGVSITPSVDFDLSTDGFMINAGYRFNAYVAIEGRYWAGGNDNTDLTFSGNNITVNAGKVDVDIDAWGLYIKPMYPVTEVFDVYGILGYGSATFDQDTTYYSGGIGYASTVSKDASSFSWGLGLSYSFTENISVFSDYVYVAVEDLSNPNNRTDTKYKVETYNLGVAYRF